MQKTHNRQELHREPPTAKPTRLDHWKIFIVLLFSIIIIIPLALFCFSVIYFQTRQINLPGVYVFDQDVSMLNAKETAALIDKEWNQSPQIHLVSAEDPQVQFILSPAEMGFWVDPEKTAHTAYQLGRDADPFSDILKALKGERQTVMPVIYYNESIARASLEKIKEQFTTHPADAKLIYQDNIWKSAAGSNGQTLDIENSLAFVQSNPFNILLTQSIPLKIQALSPAIADLSPVLDEINAVTKQDFRLTAYDPITDENFEWEVSEEIKRTWVTVDPSSYNVYLKINQQDLTSLIETWEESLGKERAFESLPKIDEIIGRWEDEKSISTTIWHKPTTYDVQPGESLWSISLKLGMPMWHIMDANEGLTVNNVQSGMQLIIPSKNILLPLPVIPEKRIVIDISDQIMRVYENGDLRNTHIVSTGMSDSPTMAGVFQIQNHYINAYASNWDLYMPHFMGIYEAWPGFMNGIHGLPLLSSGVRLWASSLGSPASYGCIILDLVAAEDLYYWAEEGVVVEITR
jgi:LysM repeat protein